MARVAMIVLLVLAGGCGTITRTHTIEFSPSPAFGMPPAGARVLVDILKDGAGHTRGTLGRMIGGPKDLEILYVFEESLASRLERDVVAALRARGYRAEARSQAAEPVEDHIVLTVRVAKHEFDVMAGSHITVLRNESVFECRATIGASPVHAWSETIEHSVTKTLPDIVRSRAFEGVHWAGVAAIVHRFSTAIPP
jgi:hypothetical protein